jgi:hypothetical protein
MNTLLPIRAAEEIEEIKRAARADGHLVLAPSHVVRNDGGDVVGYFGIGNIPLLHCWMDSQRIKARDTVSLAQTTENMLWATGARVIGCPVHPSSPMFRHMGRLGWMDLGQALLHIKTVRTK